MKDCSCVGSVTGADDGQGSIWILALREASEKARAHGGSLAWCNRCIYRREATRQELARATDLSCLARDFPSFLWQVWRNLSVSSKPQMSELSWPQPSRGECWQGLHSPIPSSVLDPQSMTHTGHTQWEARMQQSLNDSVSKSQLEGAQHGAEKDWKWICEVERKILVQ